MPMLPKHMMSEEDINRTVEAIARGQDRILPVMATGTRHSIWTGRKAA